MFYQSLTRTRELLPGEHWACLSLGSNVDSARHLRRAIRRLRRTVAIESVSTAWESPAVGSDGPDYLNAALLVRTPMAREALIATLKRIEQQLGRDRSQGHVPLVTIDIDLVIFDGDILEDDLWLHAYRAVPAAELMPGLRCSSTGVTLAETANCLACNLTIKPRPEILPGPPYSGTSRNGTLDTTRTRTT